MTNFEVMVSDKMIDQPITIIKDNTKNELYVIPSEIGNILDIDGSLSVRHYINRSEMIEHFHYRKFIGQELREIKSLMVLHSLKEDHQISKIPVLNLLTEQGLYMMLIKSSSPKAMPFEKKICQILQSIHRDGFYISPTITKSQMELLYDRIVQLRADKKQ